MNRIGTQSLPENAVVGGRDSDGSTIYVGRAFHDGDMVPAKVIPNKGVAFVCHSGEEHPKESYEVSAKPDEFFLRYEKRDRPREQNFAHHYSARN